MKKNVVAVIVTFNRKILLKECLYSLLNQSLALDRIIIIDNHSTDETEAYIQQERVSEKIIYKYLENNVGGAGGFNIGIKEAVKYEPDYIWIMDDDTIPKENALQKLMDSANELGDDFGFLASKVIWKDGTPCLMNIPKVHKDWIYQSSSLQKNMIRVESASFVSLFVKKAVVAECGFPIKEFFIWGDDLEYTRRISEKYVNYYCEESIVMHKMQQNERTDIFSDSGTRLKRYEYMYRNRGQAANRKGLYEKVKYLLRGIKTVLALLIKAPDHRITRAKVVFCGTIKGLFFNPDIEYIDRK